eukprot:GHVN01076506.1.p2 GENE.GHVN01076506.1~~GHVN01076506.1.p2  ORF type:complete len:108 (+),score=19.84 GHVN01076506.1:608-931(+)
MLETVLEEVKLRMSRQPVHLRAQFDTWCCGVDGVDAIKAALVKGKEQSIEGYELKIKMIAPPQYVIVTQCFDIDAGKARIQLALEEIKREIKSHEGGDFGQQSEVGD